MKFKRLLSSVLAVTMAISSVAMSAFTALAADTDNVELKFTQGNCTSDGGKMKYAVDGSWAPQKVMEADSLAVLLITMESVCTTASGLFLYEFALPSNPM